MNTRFTFFAIPVFVVSMLCSCGGGGSGDSADSGSSSGATSGSPSTLTGSAAGSNCDYADKISTSERQQVNACGVQASGTYAQADSGLASVIAACQRGNKATADAYYAGTYQQMVDYARSVSRTLSCGTNTAPTLPNTSAPTNYNFCVEIKVVNGSQSFSGLCHGPVKQGDGGCGNNNSTLIAQYASADECRTNGTNWLNTH